jgi:dTDP-4-amino-4,6-dideoxygalactose transaminase
MIPFFDTTIQHADLQPELEAAFRRVLSRGQFILAEETRAFEYEFAAFCGARFGVGVASGTDALHLALRACGLRPGDEVITVSHGAVATIVAIEQAEGVPVMVDIDPHTYTISPEAIEAALSPKTRAIVPVHLYGCPVDLAAVAQLAEKHNLLLIEDCAQAHGAAFQGKPVGSFGHAAAFSFYPTKNLGALGDGGMILTNDSRIAEQAQLLRQYGWRERYSSEQKGFNSRLDELQAALLRVKLPHLPGWNQRRRELAALYNDLLRSTGLALPIEPPGYAHVYHQYVIRHPERDGLRMHLKEQGIGSLIHYPLPIHLQPAYRGLQAIPTTLPHTENAARQVLSLPIYPELAQAQVSEVCEAIKSF